MEAGDGEHQELATAYGRLTKRLRGGALPTEIMALPHVVEAIDEWSMSPHEAIVSAARLGQFRLLKMRYFKFRRWYAEVMNDAWRGSSHLDYRKIREEYYERQEEYDVDHAVAKAAVAAARNGHLDVVKFLLPILDEDSRYSDISLVLEAAAVGSHLAVMEFAVNFVDCTRFASKGCGVLLRAIAKGNLEVVKFLTNPLRFRWEILKVVEFAIAVMNEAAIRMVCEAYVEYGTKRDLLVEMIPKGSAKSVRYLYMSGHNTPEILSNALSVAAYHARIDSLKVLLKIGQVSQSMFEETFKTAVYAGDFDLTVFLYNYRRVSPQAANSAFEKVGSMAVLQFLLEKEHISSTSAVAAFQFATDTQYFKARDDRESIVTFLLLMPAISSPVIDTAFIRAAEFNDPDVVNWLRNDCRLTANAVANAFTNTAEAENECMVELLYNEENLSVDVICSVFEKAVVDGNDRVVKLLLAKSAIPQAIKNKAFVEAAQCWGWLAWDMMKDASWAPDVLNAAILSTDDSVLRRILREQLSYQPPYTFPNELSRYGAPSFCETPQREHEGPFG